MLHKRQIMACPPSTNYNDLVCVTTVRNMDRITLYTHRNLIIEVAIVSDLCFAGSTLNFHILCLHFGPPIIPRIPHSDVGRTTHKLMTQDTRPYRPLFTANRRVYIKTLITQVVLQHTQG